MSGGPKTLAMVRIAATLRRARARSRSLALTSPIRACPAQSRARRAARADDFDLPAADLDSDNDEAARIMPKRNDEEKWSELELEHFLNPSRRPVTQGGLH